MRILLRVLFPALLSLFTVASPSVQGARLPPRPYYVIQEFDIDPRLATKAVVSLYQDQQGYIWMGTQHGLVRTDGAEVDIYGAASGLPSPDIIQVDQTSDGTIWVATNGGVARFDGDGFRKIERLESEGDEAHEHEFQHQKLASDTLGHLYIATASGTVQIRASSPVNRWVVQGPHVRPTGPVRAITSSADGDIWFVAGGALHRFDPKSKALEVTKLPFVDAEDHAIAVLVSHSGTVWIRTRVSLYRRDAGQETFVRESVSLPEAIGDWGGPRLDRAGGLLLPTTDGLLRKTDRGWEKIDSQSGLRAGEVTAVLEDREGALWLTVAGEGVFRWPGHRVFRGWKVDQGLPDNTVWGMLEDRRGRLWVGTSNGIAMWNPASERFKTLGVDDGLAGPVVTMFAEDAFGGIWSLSARAGMTRLHPETLTPERIQMPTAAKGHPVSLAAGTSGVVWIGSYEYLARAQPKPHGPPAVALVDLPDEIRDCTRAVATYGTVLWTSGPSGLCRFDGKSWRRFSSADGLRMDYVNQPVPVSEKEAWLVYRDSVKAARVRIGPDGQLRVSHFGKEQGMPSDAVFMAGVDRQGNAWLGGDSGLTRVAADSSVRVIRRGDGLLWDDIDGLGFLSARDGTLFFGTSGGLSAYDPRFDLAETFAPKVLILEIRFGDIVQSLSESPTVPHERRDFVVGFTGLSFQDTSRMRFRYRLVGLEQQFRKTANREVRYTNLPPGSYRFEVSCLGASGIESEQPAVFAFTVLPPWWGTWWARIGAGLILIGLISGFARLRTRRLEADRRALEKAVAERSAELAEANRELEELSFTDALTRTRNRRYFSHVILDDVERFLRRHDASSDEHDSRNNSMIFYIIDLDHFKKLNDTCGHLAGDEVLTEVGKRLTSAVRKPDLVVRWGGEEFLIVSRDTSSIEGGQLADRILETIGGRPFEIGSGSQLYRTCSVGWAPFPFSAQEPHAFSYEKVIDIADRALYLAKRGGRNRAVGLLPDESTNTGGWQEWVENPVEDLLESRLKTVHTPGPAGDGRPTPSPKAPF